MLDEGAELAGDGLEDLLGDEASYDGVDRGEVARRLVRELREDLLVEVLDGGGLGEVLGEGDDDGCVGGGSRSGKAAVGSLERADSLEADVKGRGAVELGVVGDEEFGSKDGLAKRFLGGNWRLTSARQTGAKGGSARSR